MSKGIVGETSFMSKVMVWEVSFMRNVIGWKATIMRKVLMRNGALPFGWVVRCNPSCYQFEFRQPDQRVIAEQCDQIWRYFRHSGYFWDIFAQIMYFQSNCSFGPNRVNYKGDWSGPNSLDIRVLLDYLGNFLSETSGHTGPCLMQACTLHRSLVRLF